MLVGAWLLTRGRRGGPPTTVRWRAPGERRPRPLIAGCWLAGLAVNALVAMPVTGSVSRERVGRSQRAAGAAWATSAASA